MLNLKTEFVLKLSILNDEEFQSPHNREIILPEYRKGDLYLRDSVTIFSVILEISRTYIDL